MLSTLPQRLASAATLVLCLSASACRPAPPSEAGSGAQRFSPAEVRAELSELYDRLQASHFDLFARRNRADYDAYFARLQGTFDRPLSRFEVAVAFQKFVAFGRVAHARIEFPAAEYGAFREAGGKILPLFVRVVDGAVWVTDNWSGLDALAPGDEILQLDGEPMAAVVERVLAHVSADNPYLAFAQLEPRFPALLWLEFGERAQFTLRLRRGNGNLMVRWFATEPFRFTHDFRVRVSPAAIESNNERLSADDDPTSITQRFAAAYSKHPLGAVLPFELPFTVPREGERFRGKVYLLINRHSYSNNVTVAALVQDYGFGTVLGEETADLASTYGAMEQFQLSRTGITVGFPKAFLLRPNGNPEPRGVVPDVMIPNPLVAGPEDTMLQEALVIARAGRR